MPRFVLVRNDNGYGLKDTFSQQRPLTIDFSSSQLKFRLRHGGKKELLLKSVGARPGLKVWDCTAGLGVDSLLLAKEGCEVTMFERSKILALMLRQALESLSSVELSAVKQRMTLIEDDAMNYLHPGQPHPGLDEPDVLLLDPMFPARRKSARVKGDMQIMQNFLGAEEDSACLLQRAIETGCKRIVLKRPGAGSTMTGFSPSFSLSAKSSRFDVFLNQPPG